MPKLMFPRPVAGARRPGVTIVVPCYNYGHFLPECVGSLLNQADVGVKVLIIDDASPDGSGKVADDLAAGDARVEAVRHERNRGHIATYNEGLAMVSTEYVVLLSADDLLPPGALARATALLEANPSVGLAYGHPVNFSEPVPPPARQAVYGWSVWRGSQWIRAQCRRGLGCIYSPEVVMRTEVQRRVGGFHPDLPHSGDLQLWLRFAALADIGRVNGADQAYRRVHDASMMRSTFAGVLTDLRERRKAYEMFFTANQVSFPGAARSQALARRRLAQEALEYGCHLIETGRADPDALADCVSFARECLPKIETLPAWQEYELLSGASGRPPAAGARLRAYAVRRDLAGRVRARRWQWTGV